MKGLPSVDAVKFLFASMNIICVYSVDVYGSPSALTVLQVAASVSTSSATTRTSPYRHPLPSPLSYEVASWMTLTVACQAATLALVSNA